MKITDEQVAAFISAAQDPPYGLDAIRAGLAAAQVRRDLENATAPELHPINLDPYPATVGEVADEIARFVLELEASGIAHGLSGAVRARITDPAAFGIVRGQARLDADEIKRTEGAPEIVARPWTGEFARHLERTSESPENTPDPWKCRCGAQWNPLCPVHVRDEP